MSALFALSICLASVGRPCVVLDPGHPSENGAGARGKRLTEVRAVWLVTARLKPLLEADGYRVVLTKRAENKMVTNRRRAEIANKERAELMLRLHCDAATGTGIAVYYPSKQGRTGRVRGPSKSVLEGSAKLAKPFHAALIAELDSGLRDRGLMTDLDTAIGARQGALTGSIYAKVPVLLVELCVLTNPKDEEYLVSDRGQAKLANALRAAVNAAVPPPKQLT